MTPFRGKRKKMTPFRRNLSSFLRIYFSELKKEAYLKINLVFAAVIILVFAYSGIFSPEKDNYPVVCVYEKITGKQCFSCGLSHSLSLVLRGRFREADEWNPYGLRVFLFFFSQLLMRITFSVFYTIDKTYRRQLVLYDIIGSSIVFILAFYPFFRQLAFSLFN
jgi:hypothetical protein